LRSCQDIRGQAWQRVLVQVAAANRRLCGIPGSIFLFVASKWIHLRCCTGICVFGVGESRIGLQQAIRLPVLTQIPECKLRLILPGTGSISKFQGWVLPRAETRPNLSTKSDSPRNEPIQFHYSNDFTQLLPVLDVQLCELGSNDCPLMNGYDTRLRFLVGAFVE
jgi:hypothetical protein